MCKTKKNAGKTTNVQTMLLMVFRMTFLFLCIFSLSCENDGQDKSFRSGEQKIDCSDWGGYRDIHCDRIFECHASDLPSSYTRSDCVDLLTPWNYEKEYQSESCYQTNLYLQCVCNKCDDQSCNDWEKCTYQCNKSYCGAPP